MNQSFSFVALQGLLFPLLIFFASSAKAELAVEITEPRQFGYVLGDKIERVFMVKSMKDVELDKEKIRLGRIDTWFSIVSLEDLGTKLGKPMFSLTYQVINIPKVPSMVEIASQNVNIFADGKPKNIKIPKLLVTIAPLTPRLVSNMGGLENIQPDEDLGLVSSTFTENKLRIYLLFSFVPFSLLIFCWAPWERIMRKKNLPFTLGRKEVLILVNAEEKNFEEKSLRIFHNCLNRTFKKTIFIDEIREVCKKNSQFLPLVDELEYFLLCSQKYFYRGQGFRYTTEQKTRFCKLMDNLSLIEKGLA